MFGDKIKKMLSNKEKDNIILTENNIIENKKDNGKGNNKKKIENLIFFIVIAVITIFCINMILDGGIFENNSKEEIRDKVLAKSESSNIVDNIDTTNSKKTVLEENLKQILSKVQGVGEIDVYVSYSETSEVIAMYNENSKKSITEETDDSGGIRKIEESDFQKDVIFEENSGKKIPVTQKVIEPKIEGAIITAEGAGNSDVKSNIIQAVEAVTGIPIHKIQVFKMN